MTDKKTALAFDVYGTVVDTGGIARALLGYAADADSAAGFAGRWREKQLEYSFRRSLMRSYADFGQVTREALDFICAERGFFLESAQKDSLLAEYARLPPFADARAALFALRDDSRFRLFAFSNGAAAAVQTVLENGGVLDCFADVVSADEIKVFKPSREVYSHFLRRANAEGDSSFLVSGNSFDVAGAINAGMKSVWINRADMVFDGWKDCAPTITLPSLAGIAEAVVVS